MRDAIEPADGITGGLIAALMVKIQADVQPVAKGERNQQQGYNFRGIGQVVEMMHPLLSKHGVLMLPTVTEQARHEFETKNGTVMHVCVLTVRWDFVAPDGSSLSVVTVGEGADTMDKATNKAMTAAQKYALTLAFSIPFGDQADGDADSPGERASGSRRAGAGPRVVTERQLKRLFAIASDAAERLEIPKPEVDAYVKSWIAALGLQSSRELTKQPYDKLCEKLEGLTLDDVTTSQKPEEAF